LEILARFTRGFATCVDRALHLLPLDLDGVACLVDLLFHTLARLLEGIADRLSNARGGVLRRATHPPCAPAQLTARLLPRLGRHQQRDPGADCEPDEEGAESSSLFLDDDIRFVVEVRFVAAVAH